MPIINWMFTYLAYFSKRRNLFCFYVKLKCLVPRRSDVDLWLWLRSLLKQSYSVWSVSIFDEKESIHLSSTNLFCYELSFVQGSRICVYQNYQWPSDSEPEQIWYDQNPPTTFGWKIYPKRNELISILSILQCKIQKNWCIVTAA